MTLFVFEFLATFAPWRFKGSDLSGQRKTFNILPTMPLHVNPCFWA